MFVEIKSPKTPAASLFELAVTVSVIHYSKSQLFAAAVATDSRPEDVYKLFNLMLILPVVSSNC